MQPFSATMGIRGSAHPHYGRHKVLCVCPWSSNLDHEPTSGLVCGFQGAADLHGFQGALHNRPKPGCFRFWKRHIARPLAGTIFSSWSCQSESSPLYWKKWFNALRGCLEKVLTSEEAQCKATCLYDNMVLKLSIWIWSIVLKEIMVGEVVLKM